LAIGLHDRFGIYSEIDSGCDQNCSSICHPRESGDPVAAWVPAFAGMTNSGTSRATVGSLDSRRPPYPEMRARTSHTYATPVAMQVVNCIPDFLAEATHLRDQLRQRLG